VVPGTPDGEEQDQRLEHATQPEIRNQVPGELGHGEDVDEVEEQLDRPDYARSPAVLPKMRPAPVARRPVRGCRLSRRPAPPSVFGGKALGQVFDSERIAVLDRHVGGVE
jgi:hypothetical protein